MRTSQTRPAHRARRGRARGRTVALLTGLGLAAVGVTQVTGNQPTSGQDYYLDCENGDGDGSSEDSPWGSLDEAHDVTFLPGDSLLLRSGTGCTGQLSPAGSGTAEQPVTLGSYGTGDRPTVDGDGARAAVLLENVEGWRIEGIEVTNTGPADGSVRSGILVLLEDFGVGHHYEVTDVHVNGVTSADLTGPENDMGGGVVFRAAGTEEPTGFDGISVVGNTLESVDAQGVMTTSEWNRRDRNPDGTGEYVPFTDTHIAHNTLRDIGGDGIHVQNGEEPLVEYNTVEGFGLRPEVFHIGIWSWNSDGPVFQHNEVSGGAATPLPAPAFGVDAANTDVVYQYNFSRDNGGGFMLLCGDDGMPSDRATIRYNISQNDRNGSVGDQEFALIDTCPGNEQSGLDFYNNVLYSEDAEALTGIGGDTEVSFRNNVFVGQPGGSRLDGVGTYGHNAYHRVAETPEGDDAGVPADPLLVDPGNAQDGSDTLGYALRCDSPALAAGTEIPGAPERDFFGSPVPPATPNIGVSQGDCTTPAG